MFRILVVDNEAYVVESVMFYLENQADIDAEIYGCYSAAEALQMMNRMRIDILITDIKMPEMDGLELQKKVVESWPQCRTLFLTGYPEFDYIQQAMRGGACDYLLKTEGKEVIIRAVKNIIASLDTQREREVEASKKEQFTALLASMKDQFFCTLLRESQVDVGMLEAFSNLETGFQPDRPVLLLIGRVDSNGQKLEWSDEAALVGVKQMLEQAMSSYYWCCGVAYRPGFLAWMFQPLKDTPAAWKHMGLYLNEMLETEQKKCRILLGRPISFALAAHVSDWAKLYEKRLMLENLLFANQMQEAILLEATSEQEKNFTVQRLNGEADRMEYLSTCLEMGNKAEFFQTLENIGKMADSFPDGQDSKFQLEILSRLMAILTAQLNRWDFWNELGRRVDIAPLYGGVWFMPFRQGLEFLSNVANVIFEIKIQKNLSSEQDMAQRLRWIIEQNLGGDLSLPRLGELIGMNPYYMARCYQAITGERLTNYIANARFEQAKKLIQDGNMIHRDIAIAIGFGSEQAFNRFFKKMSGIAPRDWREKYKIDKR